MIIDRIPVVAVKALELFGVEASKIHPSVGGYRNKCFKIETKEGKIVNLILYKSEPDILHKIKSANEISNILHRKNFPVRHPVDDRILKIKHSRGVKYAGLYNYLPGSTIAWEGYESSHLRSLGKSMSNMHSALAEEKLDILPDAARDLRILSESMGRYFDDNGVARALRRKLQLTVFCDFKNFSILINKIEQKDLKQPLHLDFVRGNILFDESKNIDEKYKISGILDFEKASSGHPLFDIARTLAFLLVDCKYKTPRQVLKYFLDSGYNKSGSSYLSLRHKEELEGLVNIFLLHDFYKFLKHNPFEFLKLNQHFIRTVSLLMMRGLVQRKTSTPYDLKTVKI